MKNISIIVPVYNAENTIEKTIKSVLKNKRNDIELILVIDGSTDNSLKICTKMKELDNIIKIIVQENKGTLCARLTGINNATGKYLMFLDADDEYLDNIFDKMENIIQKYSPDLIKFRYKKDEYEQYKYFEKDEVFIKKEDFIQMVYPMFLEGFQLNAIWNCCIKKDIFKKLAISPHKIKYGEDLMMNLEIFTNINSAVFLNDIYYYYYTNTNSVTQARNNKAKWIKNLQDAVEVYSSLFYYLKIWKMDTIENIRIVRERLEKEINVIIEILK